jgi:hypothetical protein
MQTLIQFTSERCLTLEQAAANAKMLVYRVVAAFQAAWERKNAAVAEGRRITGWY